MRSQFSPTSRRNELVNSIDSVNQANHNHNQNHVIGFDNIPEPYHVVDSVAAGSASISSAPVSNSGAATTTTNNQLSISNSRRRHRSRHRDCHCLSSSSSSTSTSKSSFENQSSVSPIAASSFLSSSPITYHIKVSSHMIPEIVHSSNIKRSLPITIPQQNWQNIDDRHKMKCKNHKAHNYSRSVCEKIIQQNQLVIGSPPQSPQLKYLNRTNFPNCSSSSESDEEWERRKLQKPSKVINFDKSFDSNDDEEIFPMDLEESTNASGSTTGKTKSRQPNSDDLQPQIFIFDSLHNIPDVIETTVFENKSETDIDNDQPTSISTNTTDVQIEEQIRQLGRRLRKLSVEFEERIQLVNERQPEILPHRPRFSRNFAGRLKFGWFLLKSVTAGLRNYVLNKLISFKQLFDNLYENYREHAA